MHGDGKSEQRDGTILSVEFQDAISEYLAQMVQFCFKIHENGSGLCIMTCMWWWQF